MLSKLLDNPAYYVRRLTWVYLLILACIVLFCMIRGGDFPFHMQRFQAVASNIQSGSHPKLYTATLNHYGYASPIFYGDFYMIPFALLSVLGLDIVAAYKLMCLCLLAAIFLSVRYAAHRICRSKDSADIAVFIYFVSGGVFTNVIGSGSMGRALACVFVPIAVLGLYQVLQAPDPYDRVHLAVGMAGLMCTQLIDAVICAAMLLCIVLFYIPQLRPVHIKKIVEAALLCLLLSASSVLPVLEQFADNTFFVTCPEIPLGKFSLRDYTIPLYGWFVPATVPLAYRQILVKLLGQSAASVPLYGYGFLAMLVAAFIFMTRRRQVLQRAFYAALYAVMVLCVWFQTDLFPFDAVQRIVGVMQFPWRVVIIATLSLALLTGALYDSPSAARNKSVWVILALTIFIGVLTVVSALGLHWLKMVTSPSYKNAAYDSNSFELGSAEYLPEQLYVYDEENLSAYKNYIKARGDAVLSDQAEIVASCERSNAKTIVHYANNAGHATLELPLIMYKGYRAQDAATGAEIPLAISEHGLIELQVAGESGEIVVWYAGTVVQKVSMVLSGLTAILLALFAAVLVRRNRAARRLSA